MNTQRLLIATLLASLCAPALGFEATPQGDDADRRIVIRQSTLTLPSGQLASLRPGDSASLTGAMLRLGGEQVVKGAPYSAEAVSERLQQLSDGNQIVHRASTIHYRDSAGRTRTEVRNSNGSVRTVTINDPVAGSRWILHPERKTAFQSAITPDHVRTAAEQARSAATQARIDATQARIDAARARAEAARERAGADAARRAGNEARIAADEARIAADEARKEIDRLRKEGKLVGNQMVIVKDVGRGEERPDMRVRIAQPAPIALPAARALSAQIAPMIVGAANDGRWSSTAVTRDLGMRDIGGVRAQGQQRSYEIPAGEIGNRNPIVVSSETWTSPELQILVQQKLSDPRSGELVYRLEGLKRAEPPRSLFSPPSDYALRDAANPDRRD